MMARPLNIAHCVEFYAPSVGGMQEVARQLSERMVAAGHRVTVLTSHLPERNSDMIGGVRIQGFDVKGNAAQGLSGEVERYQQALRDGGFDVITFFAAQQWTTDAALPILSNLNAAKVFVPTGFSALRDPRYAAYYAQMPAWLAAMDLNVFLSWNYQDIDLARQHGIEALTVIPNGAAEEEFDIPLQHDVRAERGIPADGLLVVHVGGLTGSKGHEEAIRIFLSAGRTKGATLLMIGNGIQRLEQRFHQERGFLPMRWKARLTGRRILFLELDRARTVSAMRQADLFLFPSRVECSPIVLFEAMAAGTPFLASNAGNAAEIATWSGSGWILPGHRHPQGWEAVDIRGGGRLMDDLLKDRHDLRAKGVHGRQVWKEGFTWRTIAQRYLEHYLRLSGGHHAG
jgi:L-malate glycosyltransferase